MKTANGEIGYNEFSLLSYLDCGFDFLANVRLCAKSPFRKKHSKSNRILKDNKNKGRPQYGPASPGGVLFVLFDSRTEHLVRALDRREARFLAEELDVGDAESSGVHGGVFVESESVPPRAGHLQPQSVTCNA